MTILQIHTDGGCSGNQNTENIGGWGAILEFGPYKKELYGGEINTTNNRMEMTALLNAFQAIKKINQNIEVYSDSGYLMDCFRDKWYIKWQNNGWINSKKQPVENRDLWEKLIPFLDKHNIKFYRVKGHLNLSHPSTNTLKHFEKFCLWNGKDKSYDTFQHAVEMNNRADALANIAMNEIRESQNL